MATAASGTDEISYSLKMQASYPVLPILRKTLPTTFKTHWRDLIKLIFEYIGGSSLYLRLKAMPKSDVAKRIDFIKEGSKFLAQQGNLVFFFGPLQTLRIFDLNNGSGRRLAFPPLTVFSILHITSDDQHIYTLSSKITDLTTEQFLLHRWKIDDGAARLILTSKEVPPLLSIRRVRQNSSSINFSFFEFDSRINRLVTCDFEHGVRYFHPETLQCTHTITPDIVSPDYVWTVPGGQEQNWECLVFEQQIAYQSPAKNQKRVVIQVDPKVPGKKVVTHIVLEGKTKLCHFKSKPLQSCTQLVGIPHEGLWGLYEPKKAGCHSEITFHTADSHLPACATFSIKSGIKIDSIRGNERGIMMLVKGGYYYIDLDPNNCTAAGTESSSGFSSDDICFFTNLRPSGFTK